MSELSGTLMQLKKKGPFTQWKKYVFIRKGWTLLRYKTKGGILGDPDRLYEIKGCEVSCASILTRKPLAFLLNLASGSSIYLLGSTEQEKRNWMEKLVQAPIKNVTPGLGGAPMGRRSSIGSVARSVGSQSSQGTFDHRNLPFTSAEDARIEEVEEVEDEEEEQEQADGEKTEEELEEERRMKRLRKMVREIKKDLPALRNIESFPNAVILGDGEGIIVGCNKEAERLFGWSEGELFGKNLKVLMPEPYRSNHDSYMRNFYRGGEPKLIGFSRDFPALKKDQSSFTINLNLSNVTLPGYYLALIREVS